jgi:hypothetical protein
LQLLKHYGQKLGKVIGVSAHGVTGLFVKDKGNIGRSEDVNFLGS